jgi:acyl-CoA thioester hydrolase
MAVYTGDVPAVLQGYQYIFEREIAWGDMDAMKHVNNTRYLHFCESARIEFLRTQTQWNDDRIPGEADEIGLALAEVSCRYKAPVVYPDTLLIGLGAQKIDANSFELKHVMYSQSLQLIAAESIARMVNYNFKALQRVSFNDSQNEFLQQFSTPSTL